MTQPSVTSIRQGNLAIAEAAYGNFQEDFPDILHFGYTGQQTHKPNVLFVHGVQPPPGTWHPAVDKTIHCYLFDSTRMEGFAASPTNAVPIESTGTIGFVIGNILADRAEPQWVLSMFDRAFLAGQTDPMDSQFRRTNYFSSTEPQVPPIYPVVAETPTPLISHLRILETVNKEWTDRLKSLNRLESDWDGYGAQPIAEPATIQTCQVLKGAAEKLQSLEHFQLFIAPMPDGGLEIDLDIPEERELMLVIPPEGTPIRFLLTTHDSAGAEIETEGTLNPHIPMTNLIHPAS